MYSVIVQFNLQEKMNESSRIAQEESKRLPQYDMEAVSVVQPSPWDEAH